MATFAEFSKHVHTVKDLILTDMSFGKKDYSAESVEFHSHLLTTKNWFSRISWANKKRFVLALLEDVKSIWTVSLLLKSIWSCRPKDAVMSVSQSRMWSSYDQVPMDHNRTALPLSTVKELMTHVRQWFLFLDPESQAIFLSELLMISGGPIMWEILQRAETLYDLYLEHQLQDLQECNVVSEPVTEKTKAAPESAKKDHNTPRKPSIGNPGSDFGRPLPGQAQKELDASLAAWNANVKSIRDRMKLEEYEMVFNDGTRKKVWKVNRPKPEAVETVDFIQLLPSEIGKRILLCLPATQLGDCARVNKYWSYLVDELRSEITTRQKINLELEKLKDNMVRHGTNLGLLSRPEFQLSFISSESEKESSRKTEGPTSARLSFKSNAHTFRLAKPKKKKDSRFVAEKPIRNLTDFNERLERRGAADENIWKWCENVMNDNTERYGEKLKETEGLVSLGSRIIFRCPLMKQSFNVPLKMPLLKNPDQSAPVKIPVNISGGDVRDANQEQCSKRYTLWSKDMCGLYPVSKLPSYQFPVSK